MGGGVPHVRLEVGRVLIGRSKYRVTPGQRPEPVDDPEDPFGVRPDVVQEVRHEGRTGEGQAGWNVAALLHLLNQHDGIRHIDRRDDELRIGLLQAGDQRTDVDRARRIHLVQHEVHTELFGLVDGSLRRQAGKEIVRCDDRQPLDAELLRQLHHRPLVVAPDRQHAEEVPIALLPDRVRGRKGRDHDAFVPLRDRRNGVRVAGAPRSKQQVHLFFGDELFEESRRLLAVGAIVMDYQLYLTHRSTDVDATGGVDELHCIVVAILHQFRIR